jgi:hypothetical protein
MVANHSRRTYVWGAILAAHDGLRYDREVVYVASLLHDLYAEHPDALPYPHCFTLPEAERAQQLTGSAGWEERRRRPGAEAITLHANLWPPRDSLESYVVFACAGSTWSATGSGTCTPTPCRPVLNVTPGSSSSAVGADLPGAGRR